MNLLRVHNAIQSNSVLRFNSREFWREFAERANFVTSVENEGMALQLASCEDQDHSTATVSTKNKFNIIIYVKSNATYMRCITQIMQLEQITEVSKHTYQLKI